MLLLSLPSALVKCQRLYPAQRQSAEFTSTFILVICPFHQAFDSQRCARQEVVSADMMIPEGRLQTLVEQALDRQLERCLYHNVRKPMVSLLSDYQCGREQIPSVVYQVSSHSICRFAAAVICMIARSKDCTYFTGRPGSME